MTYYLIDPPSPFAPLQEWIAFLKEMESIEPRTAQVQEAIDLAKKVIKDANPS